MICTGVADAAMIMFNDFAAAWAGDSESFTWTVKLTEPDCVGVPLMIPELGSSERLLGKAPAVTLHPKGVVPPVAASVALYATPTCPVGNEPALICRGCGEESVVMLNCF